MNIALWLVALVLAGVVAVAVRTDGEVDAEDFFWPAALCLAIVIIFASWWKGEDDDDDNEDLTDDDSDDIVPA